MTIPKQARTFVEEAECPLVRDGSLGQKIYLVMSDEYFAWSDPRIWPFFGSPSEKVIFNVLLLTEIREVEYLCTPLASKQWLRISWASEQGTIQTVEFEVSTIRQWHSRFQDRGVPIANGEEVSSGTWRGFSNARGGEIWRKFWFLMFGCGLSYALQQGILNQLQGSTKIGLCVSWSLMVCVPEFIRMTRNYRRMFAAKRRRA